MNMVVNSSVNMNNFTVGAPRPPVSTTWSALNSVTRSFVDYCRAICDPTIIRISTALDLFVLDLEGWKQFEESDLPLLS